MMEEDDFIQDEIINVKLPRSKYETLRKMIDRDEASSQLKRWTVNNWILIVGGALLTLFALWDRVQTFIGIK